MNCRKIWRCVIVLFLIALFILYFPFYPSHRKANFSVDFSSESPIHLLKETKRKLSLYGLLYSLDFMSIEYDSTGNKPCITKVTFGFSRYLEFDIYDAICFIYDGSSIEINHMREEAKSIFDDLYEWKGGVIGRPNSLSRDLEKLTFPYDKIVACILDENNSIDYAGYVHTESRRNMIVFSDSPINMILPLD